jgi:hypothetical protein
MLDLSTIKHLSNLVVDVPTLAEFEQALAQILQEKQRIANDGTINE